MLGDPAGRQNTIHNVTLCSAGSLTRRPLDQPETAVTNPPISSPAPPDSLPACCVRAHPLPGSARPCCGSSPLPCRSSRPRASSCSHIPGITRNALAACSQPPPSQPDYGTACLNQNIGIPPSTSDLRILPTSQISFPDFSTGTEAGSSALESSVVAPPCPRLSLASM